jgi:transketolase
VEAMTMSTRKHRELPVTPVVIRYEGPGKAAREDWHLSQIVAVFPAEAADTRDPSMMSCYSTIGQHSSAAAGYIGKRTKPATPAQVKAMVKELHKVGYRKLRVVSRASASHAKVRRQQLETFKNG